MINKILQNIFKRISYHFFLKKYGKIEKKININEDDRIEVETKTFDKNLKYNIYRLKMADYILTEFMMLLLYWITK